MEGWAINSTGKGLILVAVVMVVVVAPHQYHIAPVAPLGVLGALEDLIQGPQHQPHHAPMTALVAAVEV